MKKSLVIHPFLFAIFPVLFLAAHNIRLLDVSVIFRPMAATTFLGLLLWSLLSFVLRDKNKAGLIVSLFLLLFFSYESTYAVIRDLMVGVLGVYLFGTRVHVLFILVMLFALGTYFTIKTQRSLHNLTDIANIVGGCLVVVSLVNIGVYEVKARSAWQENATAVITDTNPVGLEEPDTLPNVYYVILDEYAGADILEELYQYDNSELLDYLTSKGFYVADRSRSNYHSTMLSLASSLNLMYLDDLVDQVGVESDDHRPAIAMIKDNAALRFLKQYGYETVAFSSEYSGTDLRNADVYMAPQWDLPLSPFEWSLIGRTPTGWVVNNLLGLAADWHRSRILYTFDGLVDVSEREGPIFVFAHILAPHAPFVFGPRGEEIDSLGYQFGTSLRDQYLHDYANQVTFINSRIKATVDGILSASDSPPIIILQADTGPAAMLDREDPANTYFKERFSILNAYYLPNNGDTHLYDEISPVNTFRIVFNHVFGTDYDLLEDESYFSTSTRPYAFINVTDEVNADTDSYDPE